MAIMVCPLKASQEPLEGLTEPVITFEGHAGQARMTLEEGLVVVLALVAGTLLFIGLAQALGARPPSRSVTAADHVSVGGRIRIGRDAGRGGPAGPAAQPLDAHDGGCGRR